MTLIDLDRLDLVGIRSMLEKNGENERLEKLVRSVFTYCEKFEAEDHISPDFFNDLKLTPERFEQLGGSTQTLTFLIRHRLVDFSSFKYLALKLCKISDLCCWSREGLIDANVLLLYILEYYGIHRAITVFLDEALPDIDTDLFLQHVVTACQNETSLTYENFKALARILIEVDHTSYHDVFAHIFDTCAQSQNSANCAYAIFAVLNHFLDKPDVMAILPTREDIIILLHAIKNLSEYLDFYLITKEKVANLRNQITSSITKKKEYSYLALCDYLFPLNNSTFTLINEWISTDNELAFSIYGDYLFNDSRDYLKEGKLLDAAYLDATNKNRNEWQRLRSNPNNAVDTSKKGE
ncbi:MAG: hypothetical protein K2M17_00650 [Bacilli bacterium]|nr:hypothetical protein [Bacilli bacterium]